MNKHVPVFLLTAYALYSAFVQVNIAHSIILFALAALFAFQLYLAQQQANNKHNAALVEQTEKLKQEWAAHKEAHESRLSGLEGELQKIAIAGLKSPSSPSSPQVAKKYSF